MTSLVVDFAKEKEEGYKRVFSQLPLLSSVSANWDGIYVAYDYLLPGQTPEICAKQHGIGIFVEMPTPAQAERLIDGRFRCEQVVQGDMVVVPANTWHRTGWDKAGGAIIIGLEPEGFARTIYEVVERDRIELIPHFATPDPLVYQIGLALKRALENSGNVSRLYAETMTAALMVHLLQHYSAQQPTLPIYSGGLSKPKLQQVIDYIHTYLDRDLSLKELAAIVQMSPHYFSQLFKQATGFTPHQYVIRDRVERAKELLRQGKLTISDIARMVGFVDQSHLHRHFKRLVGITPKAFLQQFKSSE
jgi:AraC family transcriptional regulator